MSTKPDHPLDPHLARVTTDLAQLTHEIRWAHADAWWPAAHDPLEPSRRAPRLVADVDDPEPAEHDPDYINAGRHDLGIGDDISRRAIEHAVTQLRVVEFRLAAAVWTADTRDQQPPIYQPTGTSRLDELDHVLIACTWRATALRTDAARLDRPVTTAVRRHLRPAATACGHAFRSIESALSRGETGGVAHREPLCRVCCVRPQAMRGDQATFAVGSRRAPRPSKGGRCNTCAKYFERNGNERPRDLDHADVDDALAAATRRRSRGEGWGAA